MKKVAFLFTSLIIISAMLLSLNGCSFSIISADKLLRPPKSSVELENVLLKEAGENIVLVNPSDSNSQFSSAVTLFDIDSDGADEAIIYYVTVSNDTDVHMNILKKVDNKWQSIGDFDNYGNNVETISVISLSEGSKYFEIVTTWSYIDSHVITVHKMNEKGNVSLIFRESYISMNYVDIDNDRVSELFLITSDYEDKNNSSMAKFVKINEYSYSNVSIVSLSKDIVNFEECHYEFPQSTKIPFRVIYDYLNSNGQYVTGVLYWDAASSTLKTMLVDESTKTAFASLRSLKILSNDINGDGMIEIPVQVPIVGSSVTGENTNGLFYTNWCRVSNGNKGLRLNSIGKYRYYINESVYFEIEPSWKNTITVSKDIKNNITNVCSYNPDDYSESTPLIYFINISADKSEEFESRGFVLINTNTFENSVLLYKITDEGKMFGIDDSCIISN